MERKLFKSLENYTNVLCNIATNTNLHRIIPIYQFILGIVFFSPSDTDLSSYKTGGKMEGKVKHQRNPLRTLTLISVQSLSKLVLGNLVNIYESKKKKSYNFSSFRIKTMVGGEEWRGGEALGKPVIISTLRLLKKTRGIPNVAFLFISLCSTRFPCPDHTAVEDPRPSWFEMRDRSSGAPLIWCHSNWSPPRSPPPPPSPPPPDLLLLPSTWDWSACWSVRMED